jgi:hypothetical protein
MSRFCELSVITSDESGVRDIDAVETRLIGLDQVEYVKKDTADTRFQSVRYASELRPPLVRDFVSGKKLLLPLGRFSTAVETREVLGAATVLFHPSGRLRDAEE